MSDNLDGGTLPNGDWIDDSLNAGLQAAFGGPSCVFPAQRGVKHALEETVGACSHVLLRDAADERTPLVKPPARDSGEATPSGSRYQIMGEIARGGVGVVLKCRDTDLGRDVAMKTLRPEFSGNPVMVHRFVEEAQITGQLQHPGILPVYELGLKDERTPYFTMKLVKGETLAASLGRRSDPSEERGRFVTHFEQICQTLAYAHAKGVIHRDLKPSNIMVGAFGEVQIVDWGLAKVLPHDGLADEGNATATSTDESVIQTARTAEPAAQSQVGSIMGTPAYMPPEQARGEVARLDERSDVFSLGAILCEILTGQPPYLGDRNAVLRKASRCELDDALQRLSACTAEAQLVTIARDCLATAPAARPRTAGVVADRLADFHASLSKRARESELAAAQAQAVARHERRTRRLTLSLSGVIVAAIMIVGGGVLWVQQDRQTRARIRTDLVTATIARAAELLGRASAAPIGRRAPWGELRSAVDQIEGQLGEGTVGEETRKRAQAFLAKYRQAESDRSMMESIENAVITGATHQDKASWLRMESDLRGEFLNYGIDLLNESNEKIAAGIRESGLAAQLTDGLELWIGTAGQLGMWGAPLYTEQELRGKVEILYLADEDPFRTKVRKEYYTFKPDKQVLRALAASPEFERATARTLSWLAMSFTLPPDADPAASMDAYRRALLLYPGDFMLNFDFAYTLVALGKWQEAIGYYMRCLAIRPATGGVWRSLGVAYREVGDFKGSLDALRQSVKHQPGHAATYVDLGLTFEKLENKGAARKAYQRALELEPDLKSARTNLDRLLGASDDTKPNQEVPKP